MPTSALRTRRALVRTVAVLVPALVLGACSSDADPAPAPSEPVPGISIDSNLTVGGGDVPSPSTSLSAECAELQQAWAETNRALAGIDEERPRLLVAGFREAYRSLSSAEAPEGHGFDGMETYLKTAVDALADVDADDADEVASVLTLTFTDVDTTRAAAAHAQVTAYLDDGCRG
ncbi:hypothetical protein ACNHYB_09180 [Isoptericola jiangsuensis]|uniref:hypothetical protein n=1 Tax=Isoptericola jiangsuensis TaxID=548579 RepID=UPI003AAE2C2B